LIRDDFVMKTRTPPAQVSGFVMRPLVAALALMLAAPVMAEGEGWRAPPPMGPFGQDFDFGLVESSPNAVWHMNFPTADAQPLKALASEVQADPAPVATLQRAAFSESEFSRSARVLREAAYHPAEDPVYLSPVAMQSDVADVWQMTASKPAADPWRVDPVAKLDSELDALLQAPLRSLRSPETAAAAPIPEPCKPAAPVAQVQGASTIAALPVVDDVALGLTQPAAELQDPLKDPLLSDPLAYLRPQAAVPVRTFGFTPMQPFSDRVAQNRLNNDPAALRNSFMPSYALGVRHAHSMNPLAQMPYTQQHSRYYGFP
jgi:hypothetical protein